MEVKCCAPFSDAAVFREVFDVSVENSYSTRTDEVKPFSIYIAKAALDPPPCEGELHPFVRGVFLGGTEIVIFV